MTAYYNEFEPYAAAWLRNLITAGHIADGVVDTRSIEDVRPSDLAGFTQCHFFAGVGVWSYALRRAGWPDDRPVWTGSCPCQPFSAAGKGLAFADERHLWPAFGHLIRECKPAVVLGEQVASKDVDAWIDLVHADLEAMGYAFGSVPFPSAGVGAPHIRDRNYWVANAQLQQRPDRQRTVGAMHEARGRQQGTAATAGFRLIGGVAYPNGIASGKGRALVGGGSTGSDAQQGRGPGRNGVSGGLADADGIGSPSYEGSQPGVFEGADIACGSGGGAVRPGPTNGYWRDADWLGCTDGKWRPVIASHVKVVDGPAASVVRVRTGQDQEGEIDDEILSGISCLSGDGKDRVRGVRKDESEIASAPQGRESAQQCPVELDDVVRLLSPSLSLAELHGDGRTAEALRILQRSIYQARLVLYPHQSLQEVWSSIGEEAQNRIRLGFDASRWAKLVAFPLEHGAKNRAGRLKGYGNAINAEAARVFIEAVMECQP